MYRVPMLCVADIFADFRTGMEHMGLPVVQLPADAPRHSRDDYFWGSKIIPPIIYRLELSFRLILCIDLSNGSKIGFMNIKCNEVLQMKSVYKVFMPMYCFVLVALLLLSVFGSKAATALSEKTPVPRANSLIIDAGHGGVDGGAVSCSGVTEGTINLQIALKLEDLAHLLGVETMMIRRTDCSVYTQGDTIASKKVSDLKERVRMVNETENAVVVSIHQNYFSDSKYWGAQVFYAPVNGSKIFAEILQSSMIRVLNPGSKRAVKPADGIYLMQNINAPGVLVECGFLSNREEESRLRNHEYQCKLAAVIVCGYLEYINADVV